MTTVIPKYFDETDKPWLLRLIAECEGLQGRTRRAFEHHMEQSAAALGFPKFKLALALKALDLEWKKESTLGLEASVLRDRMFTQAAELMRQGVQDWEQQMETMQFTNSNSDQVSPGNLLYSDLKFRHTLSIQSLPSLEDLFKRSNSEMILQLLRNSTRIELKINGHARAVVRQAKLFGLICNVSLRQTDTASEECFLEISGPLAILRKTTLYSKALCSLLPVIAWCPHFQLIIVTLNEAREKKYLVRNGDPLLPGTEPRSFDSNIEKKFAREFIKATQDWELLREPRPLRAGKKVIFPDFAIRHRRLNIHWYLEIIAFWTPEYLREKIANIHETGNKRILLCIDKKLNCSEFNLNEIPLVLRFEKSIEVKEVLQFLNVNT